MMDIKNDTEAAKDAWMMKEALAKLAIRVEALEKGAISEGGIGTKSDGSQDYKPVLLKTLSRMKEIHAALVTGLSEVGERLKALDAAEEKIEKQAYQIKHLKRSLETEEKKNAEA